MDLTPYPAIASALFVKITIYNSTGVQEVVRLSDYPTAITISGENYTGLGQLLSITESSMDIRATPFEVSVAISGIPTSNINLVLNNKIKGSDVQVLRGIFNPNTLQLLAIAGNPAGRFNGIVNNYQISETYQQGSKDGTCTVTLVCASTIGVLERKISGRATNPEVQKTLYPTDLSMDRVPALQNANFNFGAPR